ncbi:Leucine-rich repeat neuronal protein 1 [Toxocara canis]|uniref:Leucine-rich repeat neuronal protein 1 n=1 Tax=Toxocara canis TaxID=6265 RepID=A0A0B2VWX0_TOXCA|nr:Leucine-rich repeat neuronal protein 1 [Toxocara canis]
MNFPNNFRYLDLSGNALTSFNTPRQSTFPSVTTLILRANKFQAINEHMLRFTTGLEFLDISYNRLIGVQSSNFFAAQKLKAINFSHNMIRRFDYDSFSPLYQLEMLDLSFNDLKSIPGGDLRQFIGLRVLRLDGNHFDKIVEGDFVLPALRELSISNCFSLRLVESNAFSSLPSLHSVDLSGSSNLVFISPHAFAKNTVLHSVNISKTRLETVPKALFASADNVTLGSNPLQCGCIKAAVDLYSTHIVDVNDASCSTLSGFAKRLSDLSSTSENCRPEPILPFGDTLTASIGEFFSIYCTSREATDIVSWRFPNGTEFSTDPSVVVTFTKFLDVNEFLNVPIHVASTGSHGYQFNPQMFSYRPRISITSEQLRFDALFAEDSGEYRCSVRRGSHISHRAIRLNVIKPSISLYALEVGSHYATLAWNDSLKIKATDRIHLLLHVKDATGLASRTIQLSLHNPWFSYNVMRLKPNQNYTFCLCYAMHEQGEERALFETCTDIITLQNLSFFHSLSLPTVLILITVGVSLCVLFCFRNIYLRFHIWQQQKYRSRMNQSISGQSFFSSSSSNGREPSLSVTYENQLQISLSQTASLCYSGPESTSARRDTVSSDRLLTEDMAL